MVRFFQKKEESTQLTESEIEEIRKSAYNLGFEVGYHKHSELGWVSEQYSMLEDLGRESGLGTLVTDIYKKGKEEGARAKERDVKNGLARKDSEKHQNRANVNDASYPGKTISKNIDSGYRGQLPTFMERAGPVRKPSMTDLPESTSRIKAIDRPSQIKGFKLLTPKS